MENNQKECRYVYIEPKLRIITDEKRIGEKKFDPYASFLESFKSIYQQKNLVISAKPGNGKSRLLKEVVLKAEINNHEAIFLDLKKVGSHSIEEIIHKYQKRSFDPSKINSNDDINKFKAYLKTSSFELQNKNDFIVCLDALDEVKKEQQLEVVEKIKEFHYDYPNIKIIISCRDYIFNEFADLFSELTPTILETQPFQELEIETYLKKHSFDSSEVLQIIQRFKQGYTIEVINSPRILEVLIQVIRERGLTEALTMTKADLLDHFIYSRLYEEDQKVGTTQREVLKRLLKKLALTMQIYQSREISKEEVITFFEDIVSTTGLATISPPLADFYNRSLLIENKKTIQFENAEFQDYLAAKEIQDLGSSKIDQRVFDLVFDEKLQEIYPFWFNSLQYLVSLEPILQKKIVDFVTKRNKRTDSTLLEYILEPYQNIGTDKKNEIFASAFQFFQSNGLFIGKGNVNKIGVYYTPASENILKQYISLENNQEVSRTCNVYSLIAFLKEQGATIDTEYWKQKLDHSLKLNSNSSILIMAVRAIARFQDISLLKDNYHITDSKDKDVLVEYVQACEYIDPNDHHTIDALFRTLHYSLNRYPLPNFNQITTQEGISYLLQKIALSDSRILYQIEERTRTDYNIKEGIFYNIQKVFNSEIEESIKSILLDGVKFFTAEKFIKQLVEILINKKSNFIYELIDRYEKLRGKAHYEKLISSFLNIENTEEILKRLTANREGYIIATNIFYSFKFSENNQNQEIYHLSKKYLSEQFEERENILKEHQINNKREGNIYKKFKFKLLPKEGNYVTDVFEFYRYNKGIIDKYIQEEDFQRLRHLVILILDKCTFENTHITIKKVSEEENTVTISDSIYIFSQILPILADLGIDPKDYRRKIIKYLPFSFDYETKNYIFKLIPQLSSDEVNYLINFINRIVKMICLFTMLVFYFLLLRNTIYLNFFPY